MDKKYIIALGIAAVAYSGWWYLSAGNLRDGVSLTIEEVQHHIRVGNPNARLHVDGVHVSGFPLARRATIENARISTVYGDETFAVEAASIHVTRGSKDGEYRWQVAGNAGGALYAKEGATPEEYRFTWDHDVMMHSMGDGGTTRLSDVAFALPESVTIDAALGEKNKKINFAFDALKRLAASQIQPLPKDMSPAVMLMVGTLREALVYR